jgi:HD-GYP domain-containing protein (c-di-GMP phosphodiesterase class II)
VRSELAVPLRVAGEIRGAINLEHTEVDFFDLGDARLVQAIGAQLGGALHAIELYAGLEQAYMDTAVALAAALEAKDPDTARHSSSIVDLAVAVGERLGIEAEQLRALRYGAAFHDIGKLAIPRRLLNKAGPLTEEERRVVEQHTLIGERILAPIEFLAPVLPLVRHAHERWDGRGYPDGLAGAAIPLGARVVFACDAYDAMSNDRPYRGALAPSEVRAELRDGAGSQFDPAVVEALLAVLDEPGGGY